MDAQDVLRQEISALEKEIEARKSALRALLKGQSDAGKAGLRFYQWRPLDAIRLILTERGRKMKRKELFDTLMAGGIAVDRVRSGANIRISIEKNVALKNLIELPDDYIDLPERAPKTKKK